MARCVSSRCDSSRRNPSAALDRTSRRLCFVGEVSASNLYQPARGSRTPLVFVLLRARKTRRYWRTHEGGFVATCEAAAPSTLVAGLHRYVVWARSNHHPDTTRPGWERRGIAKALLGAAARITIPIFPTTSRMYRTWLAVAMTECYLIGQAGWHPSACSFQSDQTWHTSTST